MPNQRVRLEAHIEDYLRSQSQRVLGKSAEEVTSAELTTLTNTLIYEHKLAQSMTKQIPFSRIVNWLTSLIPVGGKVIPMPQPQLTDTSVPKSLVEDFDFDADLGDIYEDAA